MNEPAELAGPSSNNRVIPTTTTTNAPINGRAPPPAPPLPRSSIQNPFLPMVIRAQERRSPSPAPSDDPKQDLWLSTVDGRYGSPTIPIRVGRFPHVETFFVHRDILIRSKWFERALCGNFKEADEQVIDLPEEEPRIFHFFVSFLYERRFEPIQPIISALRSGPDKGKGREENPSALDAGSDSSSSSNSSSSGFYSTSSREQAAFRERQRRRAAGSINVKTWGQHRTDCRCDRCAVVRGPGRRCNHCGEFPEEPVAGAPRPRVRRLREQGMFLDGERVDNPTHRISPEEMPVWLMTFELNIDVYICAVRFLMDDFRAAIMRSTIDMLETAGTEAAEIQVLRLCGRLREGVPETDPLLSMVLARVGFLQALLWKKSPVETGEFLVANPELAAVMLRETSRRHETQDKFRNLPSMELGFHEMKTSSRA